jgi:hypothetical protein
MIPVVASIDPILASLSAVPMHDSIQPLSHITSAGGGTNKHASVQAAAHTANVGPYCSDVSGGFCFGNYAWNLHVWSR